MDICPKLRTFKLFVTASLPDLGNTLSTLGHCLDQVFLSNIIWTVMAIAMMTDDEHDKLILLNLTQNPGDPGLPTSTHLPHRLHRLPRGLWQVACYNHLQLPSCCHHVIVHPDHRG